MMIGIGVKFYKGDKYNYGNMGCDVVRIRFIVVSSFGLFNWGEGGNVMIYNDLGIVEEVFIL